LADQHDYIFHVRAREIPVTVTPDTSVQQQARALGDPTRYAVFRHIADAGQPVGIAELTERFSFNHNAIRQHLAKLVDAGLVVESKAAANGPGRPRLLYTVSAAAEGQWGTTGPYERLSGLLAEVVRTGLSPEEVGRRAGSGFRTRSPSGDVVADMTAAMARHGFDPEVRPVPGGAEIVLRNCPFESAARTARDAVCSLHLGIAQGLAAGTTMTVEELVAQDPRRAGCRIRLRLASPETERDATSGTLSLRGRSTNH
jgi:predicted ArsR family transcriptional regulator